MIIQIGEMTLNCADNSLDKLANEYAPDIIKSIKDDYYDEYIEYCKDDEYMNDETFSEFIMNKGESDLYAEKFLDVHCMNTVGKHWSDIYFDYTNCEQCANWFIDDSIDRLCCLLNDVCSDYIDLDA